MLKTVVLSNMFVETDTILFEIEIVTLDVLLSLLMHSSLLNKSIEKI